MLVSKARIARFVSFAIAVTTINFGYIEPAQALARAFDLYIDQPLVQGSYVSDATTINMNFDSFSSPGVNSCTNQNISPVTITGACSILGTPDSDFFGASFDDGEQHVGGTPTKFVTGYPGSSYRVTFSTSQKYVGFWWSAGSPGNEVNFLSHGAVVASVNVNQVYGLFGISPYLATSVGDTCYGGGSTTATTTGQKCFGNSMDFDDSSAIISSIDGTKYLKNLYYGNPAGFSIPAGGSAYISPSQTLYGEPFVYIHAFAKNGAYFDAVEFSGSGFEIDNLAFSTNEQTPRNQLVFVSSVVGNYIVDFDSNGGSAVPSASHTSAGTISAPTVPTKSGYWLDGWYDAAIGGNKITFPFLPGEVDITLYAHWIANNFSYTGINPSSGLENVWVNLISTDFSHANAFGPGYQTVYFRAVANASGASPGGWQVLSADRVRDGPGSSIDVKIPPGYSFLQFHVDACANWPSSNGGCYAFDNAAVYSIKAPRTLVYNSNYATGGTAPTDSLSPYAEGASATILSNNGNLVRNGYTFAGWNTAADGTGFNYEASGSATLTLSDSNVILYAKWNANGNTVSFNANTGSGSMSNQIINSGAATALLSNSFYKTGYTFSSWNTQSDGLGVSYTDSQTVTIYDGLTLYAKWSANSNTVSYNANSGTGSMSNQMILTDSSTALSANAFTRNGYTFNGWNTAADGTGVSYTDGQSVSINSDLNLFAKWSVNTYNVNFDTQGGSSASATTYQTGGSITLPSASTRSNYTFNGWFTSPTGGSALTSPYTPGTTSNLTLYAQWTQVVTGGGGAPAPAPIKVNPVITWNPTNMEEGDATSFANPLNANFSVPGSAIYSIASGTKPAAGPLTISVTFTPTDTSNYNSVSTTRTIQVVAKATPSPTPTPSPSVTSSESPTPTPTPTPSATESQSPSPIPTRSPTPSTSPTPSPTNSQNSSQTPTPKASNSSKPISTSTPSPIATSKTSPAPAKTPVSLTQVKGSFTPAVDPKKGDITVIVSGFPVKTSPTSKLIAVATDPITGSQITANFAGKAPGSKVTLSGTKPGTTYKVELLYISTTGQLKTLQQQIVTTPKIKASIAANPSSAAVSVQGNSNEKVRVFIGKVQPSASPTPTVKRSQTPTASATPKVRIFIGKAEK